MPSVIIPPTDVSPYTGSGDQVLANSPTIITPTITGKLQAAASTLTSAGLNLPQGTAPSAPVNGDLWTTSAGLYARIAGSTVGPLGSGTVTSVSVVSANGVSGTVATPTTTPAITLSLGAITPSTVNGVTLSGTSSPTLAVTGTSSISGSHSGTSSGTNTGDQTITLTGNVTGSGTGSFATTIAAGVVTNSMLSNVATATFKGRTTAGTGSPEDLTATQATAILNQFTSALQGVVPASGGGTSNYLRADGTWSTPSGGTYANPTASIGLTAVNGTATTAMRSDAAPALSQTIVPTWTGIHTFSPTIAANTSGDGVVLSNPTAATAGNQSYSPRIKQVGRIWSGSASQTAVVTTEVQNSSSGANDLLYLTKYSVAGGTEYNLVAITGRTATVSDATIAIGPQAVGNGWAGISIGGLAVSGEKCVSIGGSVSSSNESVAIGYLSSVGSGPSIAIGARSATTAANQFVAGSGNNPISSVYFGKGVISSSATAYTIYGTSGSGTNNAGAALNLCAGVSTGNATPGSVVIQGGTAGASGSTYQTVSNIATFTTTGVTIATSLSDSIGNVRSIPQNAQTAAYALAASDNGKHIAITTGGVTVNSGIFSAGNVVVIFNNSGSSQTITQGTSVTMYLGGAGTTGNRTLAGYGVATVLCVASNTFVITGTGLT